jgi:hypothetical protein
MGLITETNAQYYSGQQILANNAVVTAGSDFLIQSWSFDTNPVSAFGLPVTGLSPNRELTQIGPTSNFTLYFAPAATPNTYSPIPQNLVYVINTNELIVIAPDDTAITGTDYSGNWYAQLNDQALWDNYNSYSYVSLDDIINNFIVAYVGKDKLIPDVKRTDVMFHAKRGLQEFSYDTLKSVKTQEVTIPTGLSVIIPQDYVNYVQLSWIDNSGVKRIIYPTDLTVRPTDTPLQDNTPEGVPIQDNYEENTQGTSLTNERWDSPATENQLISDYDSDFYDYRGIGLLGERYGLETSLAQRNGWFVIDERKGKFSFSSNLVGQLITIEYISDGLAYDKDTRIPKFAEQALYMHIAHAILSTRMNIPEYVVQRFKRDRRAALRNAKIRLSNIKLNDFIQIMRGQAKWIKH